MISPSPFERRLWCTAQKSTSIISFSQMQHRTDTVRGNYNRALSSDVGSCFNHDSQTQAPRTERIIVSAVTTSMRCKTKGFCSAAKPYVHGLQQLYLPNPGGSLQQVAIDSPSAGPQRLDPSASAFDRREQGEGTSRVGSYGAHQTL